MTAYLPENIVENLVQLAALAPLIGGAWYIWRKLNLISRLKRCIRECVKEIAQEQIAPISSKIDEIFEQIMVNGYRKSTLRDKLSSIDDSIHLLMLNQRANIDNMPQPRFECDSQGRCIWVNEALCELFGQSFNDMTCAEGTGWLASIEEPEKTFHVWMEAVHAKIPYQREYIIRNLRTHCRYKCIARAKPLLTRDGSKVIVWHGSVNIQETL